MRARILLVMAAVLASLGVCPRAAAAATLTDLGAPITNVANNKSSYSADGATVYLVTSGNVAGAAPHFRVVDVRTASTTLSLALPNATGAWELATAPDGSVYVATYPYGHLLRYRPGSGVIDDLGQPATTATFLYSLSIDRSGTVFVGDYPTGKVFSYTPSTAAYRDYGQISADSLFVYGLAAWGGSLLIALGAQQAHLYGMNIQTGVKYEIALPAPYNTETQVRQVTVRGDYAYVYLSGSRALLAYDLYSKTWSTAPGLSSGLDVSPVRSATDPTVYYVASNGTLGSYNPVTGVRTGLSVFSSVPPSSGMSWVDGSLVMIDFIGQLWKYNPTSGAHSMALANIPGEPVSIRSVGIGPDRRIYAGGLGSGGLAAYDPASGAMSQYQRGTIGQTDQMLTVGGLLYLGVYPRARILRFNPAQLYLYGTNPLQVAQLDSAQQDRPFGLAAAAGLVVVGTVPAYGQLTGAVTVYDPATGAVFTDRGVVGTHSVVSLVSNGSIVYGSTSKWGGLGVTPPSGDGTVFAYDPVARRKLWEIVPVPGQPAVTELAFAPDGHLWAYTSGALAEIDPASHAVLRTIPVPAENWSTVDHVWSEGQRLAVASDGTIYVAVGGQLLQVNPATGGYTQLTQFVHAFTLADDRTLYLARGANLYRLTL